MADTDLNIILKLKDELSKNLASVQNNTIKFSDSIKKMGDNFDKVGREMSRFGQDLAMVGGVITGAFTAVLIKAAERSVTLKQSFESLKEAGNSVSDTIGKSLAPLLEKLVGYVQQALNWFNNLNPVLRDNIIQWVAIGGAVAVVSGIITSLTGKIISIIGNVLQVTSAFMKFAAVHPYLLAIGLAISTIAYFWKELSPLVQPIIDKLIQGLQKLKELFNDFIIIMRLGLAEALENIAAFISIFNQMPYGIGNACKVSESDLKSLIKKLRDLGNESIKLNAVTAKVPEMGNFEKFYLGFKSGLKIGKDSLNEWYEYGKGIATKLGSAFQDSLGNFFYNTFKGDMASAKQAFQDFGNVVLKLIAEIIAKMMIAAAINMFSGSGSGWGGVMSTMGSLFGGGGSAGGSALGGLGGVGSAIGKAVPYVGAVAGTIGVVDAYKKGSPGQGAASGAVAGASIGSIVPGIGTVIGAIGGAIVGGIAGLLGGKDGPSPIETALKNVSSSLNQAMKGDFSQLQKTAEGFGSIGAQLLKEGVFTKLGGDLQSLGGAVQNFANGTGKSTDIVSKATETLRQHLKDTGGVTSELDKNLINIIRTFSGASFNANAFANSIGLTAKQMAELGLAANNATGNMSGATKNLASMAKTLGNIQGSHAIGTNYIPSNGLYMLHKGEKVIPENATAQSASGSLTLNISINAMDGASVKRVMPEITQQLINDLQNNGAFRGAVLRYG
jgi:methyl-accepting chemotaxis protein